MTRVLAVALALVTLLSGRSGAAHAAAPPLAIRGEHFVDQAGRPVFLLGANYEGPADRAWQMWEDGLFDAGLIARDFDRARAANLSVLRIFVQRPLADDIRAGRWAKLDRVLDLADRSGLGLIVTFADYTEVELARLVQVDAAVARRYRGRPTIFAYDLKNEPHFGDLALVDYPPPIRAALQQPDLVAALGERVARQDIPAHRATDQGRRDIPERFGDDRAYVYANVLAAYRQLLQDGQAWANAHNSTTVGYLLSPDSAPWDPLKGALDDTLAAWLKPRLDALRSADRGRPVTIGHVDTVIASLSSNALLDYRTLHRYPPASSEDIKTSMTVFDDLRAAQRGKPLVLGEFGFSNATDDEHLTAALETEMVRGVCNHGLAGALKWMLNDYPKGADPRQNAFGMFRADGSAKPVVGAFHALRALRPLDRPLATDEARPPDYDLCDGHFFTQTSGQPASTDRAGYSVTNADGIPFWDAFREFGGVATLGYPIGRRFVLDGRVVQPMQQAALEWRPGEQRVVLLDTSGWRREAGPLPPEALALEPPP